MTRRSAGARTLSAVLAGALFGATGINAANANDSMGVTTLVSVASDGGQATGVNGFASTSGDGRYIAFQSNAPDLVEDDTNQLDVFVRDRSMPV